MLLEQRKACQIPTTGASDKADKDPRVITYYSRRTYLSKYFEDTSLHAVCRLVLRLPISFIFQNKDTDARSIPKGIRGIALTRACRCQSFGLMVSLLTAALEYKTMVCGLIREGRRDE